MLATTSATTANSPKFGPNDGFQNELKRRVDQYFEKTGKSPRDNLAMYLKTFIVISWFALSYVLLVFVVDAWWQAIPVTISFAMAAAAVTFNVQHDGGHNGYSDRNWINKLTAFTMDLVGASSYLWKWKHAVHHHTFVNVAGQDTDIEVGVFARLSPEQPRRWFHRFQHFYMWALYCLMVVRWHLMGDFQDLIRGKIGDHKIPRPRGWDMFVFVAGKVFSLSLVLVIPCFFHPVWVVVLYYLFATAVMGQILAVVFQLAHCIEEADFPVPDPQTKRLEHGWAEHQVETTVDFARGSGLLTFLLGGLNFQIEHHLFPRICHVHYPAISKIVEETSREFGVRYMAHESMWDGIKSHYRWLRRMGRPPMNERSLTIVANDNPLFDASRKIAETMK